MLKGSFQIDSQALYLQWWQGIQKLWPNSDCALQFLSKVRIFPDGQPNLGQPEMGLQAEGVDDYFLLEVAPSFINDSLFQFQVAQFTP